MARRQNRERVDGLTRILTALAIAHRVEVAGRRATLWVAAPHAPFARRQLARLEAQSRQSAVPAVSETPLAAAWSSLLVAGGLTLLHLLITGEAQRELFYGAYGAVDRLIRAGEWYRCVSALLLHSTPAHLLGNAAALILFGPFVCRRFGHGWGWLLVLTSGVGGNCLNAWVRKAPQLLMGPHLSVGASTAVFGAVGILVAVNLHRRRETVGARWRSWTPLAGGLGFLAFMGSAPGSDLLAHLFGFAVGLGIGAAAGPWRLPVVHMGFQALTAFTALATVVWAWSQGLGPSG